MTKTSHPLTDAAAHTTQRVRRPESFMNNIKNFIVRNTIRGTWAGDYYTFSVVWNMRASSDIRMQMNHHSVVRVDCITVYSRSIDLSHCQLA